MEVLLPLGIGAAVGGGIAAATAKKPKPVSLPAVPALPAVPTTAEVSVGGAGEAEVRAAKRRRGRAETVITGALEPVTKKKTILG